MSEFLSEEWLADFEAATADLPAVDGATATVLYVISGTPHGKVQYRVSFDDGQVTSVAQGKGDNDITVTWKYEQAVAEFDGSMASEVSFMQGRTKVEGDYVGYLLGLRPVLQGEPYRAALAGLAADTAF